MESALINDSKTQKWRDGDLNVGNDGKNGGKNGSLAGRIIDILSEEPQITMPQMAAKASTSLRSVEREMKILRESGCIERADGRRYGYWKIIDKYHDLFELKYDKKREFHRLRRKKGRGQRTTGTMRILLYSNIQEDDGRRGTHDLIFYHRRPMPINRHNLLCLRNNL